MLEKLSGKRKNKRKMGEKLRKRFNTFSISVCLVRSRFQPFINALQMCHKRFYHRRATATIVSTRWRSIDRFFSENRKIVNNSPRKPKIDTNFMLDGTWGSFERQNTWHFVSVDCHSCTILGREAKQWMEGNRFSLFISLTFRFCAARDIAKVHRENEEHGTLQKDPSKDAVRAGKACETRIKAETRSQLTMFCRLPSTLESKCRFVLQIFRPCLSFRSSFTLDAAPKAINGA